MIDLSRLRQAFAGFSSKNPRIFSAPGRINLIGEHTDYNEGFVLPAAANLRTYVAGAIRSDQQVRVLSLNLNETASFSLELAAPRLTPGWVSYVEGIARTLVQLDLPISGADMVLLSEVPIGGGLSSSAALEVSVGFALIKLSGLELGLHELATAAQRAEHDFVGTRSGLMDQLAVTQGKRDHAMLIDCRSLQIKQIPMSMERTSLVVCDTQVKHKLASSDYNKRRAECEDAVKLLRQKNAQIRSLRDLSPKDQALLDSLPEPQRRRARHVVSENARTLAASTALERNDIDTMGRLMIESHQSLRDDFEVSCRELDIMFELARKQDGVLGSRMMGGGFGGCTINLVENHSLDNFIAAMTAGYQTAMGLAPKVTSITADDGVSEFVPNRDDSKT
jgi:galactokinase